VQQIVESLAVQHGELDGLLSGLDEGGWSTQTRCPGWSVADVVLHLAQTDELAVASAEGRLDEAGSGWPVTGARQGASVDDNAAAAVAGQRGAPAAEVLARWRAAAAAVRSALAGCEPGTRLTWVAGQLSARTLATTRLAECWIHTGDVADAIGADLTPGERLRDIARLAWRTLPYAFARAGTTLSGPVAVVLDAPGGGQWSFGDDAAATTVRGDAVEFCLVAGRRLDPARTRLTAEGPDAAAVLELVRTYA
jgi:uncharacterized protein (TIGR03084 family)